MLEQQEKLNQTNSSEVTEEENSTEISLTTSTSQQNKQNDETNDETPVKLLKYSSTLLDVTRFSVPFAIARSTAVIDTFVCGIIFVQLGPDEVAAGPLISTLRYVAIGVVRGLLSSTGIVISQLNGAGEYKRMGNAIRQSLFLGVVASVPTLGIFLSARYIYSAKTPEPVLVAIQNYFNSYCPTVLPMYWLHSYSQLALAVKRPNICLIANLTQAFLTAGISYSLALGGKLGMQGTGYGAAIGAWLTLGGLLIYYRFNKDFQKFHLFAFNVKELFTADLLKQLKLGIPLSIQVFNAWGNLFIISIISGKFGRDVLIAEQPSSQVLVLMNLLTTSFSQAMGVLIANVNGVLIKAKDQNNIIICKRNIAITGNAGIISGTLILTGVSIGLMSISRPLSKLFIGTVSEEILILAQTLLLINGVGLIADAIKSMAAGNLSGLKDMLFSTVLSFITITVIGLAAGYGLTFLDNNVSWLFITRDIGIILAAIGIVYRWHRKSKFNNQEEISLENSNDSATINNLSKSNESNELVEESNQEIQPSDKMSHKLLEEHSSNKKSENSTWQIQRFFKKFLKTEESNNNSDIAHENHPKLTPVLKQGSG